MIAKEVSQLLWPKKQDLMKIIVPTDRIMSQENELNQSDWESLFLWETMDMTL
jgi:hypothetical protein